MPETAKQARSTPVILTTLYIAANVFPEKQFRQLGILNWLDSVVLFVDKRYTATVSFDQFAFFRTFKRATVCLLRPPWHHQRDSKTKGLSLQVVVQARRDTYSVP